MFFAGLNYGEPQVFMESRPSYFWFLPPLLAGITLRVLNLANQIVGGDELHAVRASMQCRFPQILFTYQPNDHCIPLSALYRVFVASDMQMTEILYRLPVLVSGVVFLFAGPLLVSRVIGRRAALIFCWLLALSPVVIYYSRIVRSYVPMVLLVYCALCLFYKWWISGRALWWVSSAICSSMALYFHLGAGPILVAPYFFALGAIIFRRWSGAVRRPSIAPLCLHGLLQLILVSAFLIPGRASLASLIASKQKEQKLSFEVLWEVLCLQSGTNSSILVIFFWSGVLVGMVMLIRKSSLFGFFTFTAILMHIVGLLLLSPLGLEAPHILNRYLLPILPLFLLYFSVFLSQLWLARRGRQWTPVVAAGIILLFVFYGPLNNAELLESSFVHHNDFIRFSSPSPDIAIDKIPEFYIQLAAGRIASGPVLEYPWTTFWHQSQALYIYQRIHKQDVLVVPAENLYPSLRLRFRNMSEVDADSFLESRARYFILHLDWVSEERMVINWPPMKPELSKRLKNCANKLFHHLQQSWGPPDYIGPELIVWDMGKIRNS